MDRKKSVMKAIMNNNKRQLGSQSKGPKPTRRNKSPEKDVESSVLQWCKTHDLHLHVVEANAGFDYRGQGFRRQAAQAGFPDLVGNHQSGLSVYVELKAKDRRSALKDHQRQFLLDKIDQFCFAVCVDSSERLAQYWTGFHRLKNPLDRVAYLKDSLPKKRQKKTSSNDELPF